MGGALTAPTTCAAGDSETGDASLKLLLSAYIGQLNMMPELFDKSQQEEEKGIWELAGFKLPQLGHLLVADESSKLCDSETGAELRHTNGCDPSQLASDQFSPPRQALTQSSPPVPSQFACPCPQSLGSPAAQ